jgi:RHS repeat-associated protein
MLGLPAPRAARAQDRPFVRNVELDERAADAVADQRPTETVSDEVEQLETLDVHAIAEAEADPTEVAPVSLPGDQQASAVTPQALSLPEAEGSIEGMGESFSPVLSSGTATYNVPIAVPAGRAGVQPTLALSYSSTGGNSCVGFGWSFEAPYISRQTDRGLPRYVDRATWTPEEDRFFYNGGQELVPVSTTAAQELDGTVAPPEYASWQQYRARVEGAFMRFYRGPDGRSWAVQGPDGSLLEFGELAATSLPSDFGTSASALQTEDGNGRGRIFRWFLTRMSDIHGSTVYYRYAESLRSSEGPDGSRYLVDIHYGSPAACAVGGGTVLDARARRHCTAPLAGYGRRVRFQYENRPDVFFSYIAGWRVELSQRLTRIVVTSAEDGVAGRFMVRRYHLGYAPSATSFHSLLSRVEVEGRPDASDGSTAARVATPTAVSEATLDGTFGMVGPTLPPLRFQYSGGLSTSSTVDGFGGISGLATRAPSSPPHSVDEGFADLFDVNSDGLPDLLVTDPARYRTRSGSPASGVFFNGFAGSDARPSTVGTFSGAVPMPVPSGLSGALDLSNLNVVPMDIDGDGRSDLLHMPRAAAYGYFLVSRDADGSTPAVSPAQQGWRFSYVPVALPTGVTDPRIDLGRDGAHVRAFDVNNDHLVDVVRTAGTVMQTWLNLGWLPGGDGRFGSARWTGSRWALSTDPIESCLLESGTPLDFEDPEARLADMNGDGIQDVVRIRRGRLVYWPGRGEGSWGEGPQACARGAGADRYIDMSSPPTEINVELDGVYLEDVNEDGAADVVQVRLEAIDVWFNRAGRSFTSRVTAMGTPARPAYLAGRIRFADMDGSGTTDVLYGNADDYRWVDLMGGVRPRLLTSVDNGLGALTRLEYGSSAEEYLRDLRAAVGCASASGTGACRDRFTWSRVEAACDSRIQSLNGECVHRSGGTPLVVQVVKAVETTDRLDALGREETVTRSEYAFHDGYYEGFEQELRGFGAADATAVATGEFDTHPTGTTRSYFHQGRRPSAISTDRLADNPYESLKARVYMTESFDPATGRTLSTGHTTHTVRRLLTGQDGRGVWFSFASATDELRYDTSLAEGGGGARTFDAVRFESVSGGAIPSSSTLGRSDVVTERWGGAIHLASRVVRMDNFGHALESAALGRVGADEAITTHSTPSLLSGADGRWLWRDGASYVTGSSSGTTRFAETEREHDELGNLVLTRTFARLPSTHPTGFEFLGDDESGPGLVQADQTVIASSAFDAWGNAVRSCGGADLRAAPDGSTCLRYGEVSYDATFSQFPVSERIAVAASGAPEDRFLTTTGHWDQGLGLLLEVTDANGLATDVSYDAFGRVSTVRPPASGTCSREVPVQWFEYALTTSPASEPVSVVTAHQENACSAASADALVTRTYVDGLGRPRASLASSENAEEWIQSGIAILNTRGSVRRAYQPARIGAALPSLSRALQIPAVPYEEAGFDAFDRQVARFPAVGGLYFTTHHALASDECDPLDHDPSAPHYRTCTTSRSDGHGRVVDQVLRNRRPGITTTEYHRLFTTYRADNAVMEIVRAETTSDTTRDAATVVGDHSVTRTFTYDTAGRRLGTTDPDSDSDAPSRSARNRTWRYLFNRVGDLVAVRDPRGCGQDFYYDHAARLVAESYVGCSESSTVTEGSQLALPHDAIGLDTVIAGTSIDVLYTFDELPSWVPTGTLPSSAYRGRLGGTEDRGQRSAMAYDDRGQVVASARQVALLPELAAPAVTTVNGLPQVIEPPTSPWARTYDVSHTYVRTASYDHGGRPTSMTLPLDPDYAGGPAPEIGGTLEYNARGLPSRVSLTVGTASRAIVDELAYTRDGLVEQVTYGDDRTGDGSPRSPTVSFTTYDDRRRPVRMRTERVPNAHAGLTGRPLEAVSSPHDQMLVWDLADNLIAIEDLRDPTEWPDGFRPQSVHVTHDSLYRVAGAEYEYTTDTGGRSAADASSDWRGEMAAGRGHDPMRTAPAPMVSQSPSSRVASMTWEHDWLGNMQSWDDDAAVFYERSLGDIVNGADLPTGAASRRTGALYVASNLPTTPATADDGGWVEVRYGEDGNALSVTVHGRCGSPAANGLAAECRPSASSDPAEAIALSCAYACAVEQHFTYAWDEVNRIAHARRFDRSRGGSGSGGSSLGGSDIGVAGWQLAVEQRYLYDASNQRTVKTTTFRGLEGGTERCALYVYPGDFERRGLQRSLSGTSYEAIAGDTETQYGVGGARIVWRTTTRDEGLDRDQRITMALTDLIQSTTAVVDLATGELVESGSHYANGARETYRSNASESVAPEPMGFTGKEADEEVGLTYFGHRYLMAHLGRWASPDPLQTHAVGGGEAVNGYHYVSGNVLQARDPVGLDAEYTVSETSQEVKVVAHVEIVVWGTDADSEARSMAIAESARDIWRHAAPSWRMEDGRQATLAVDVTVRRVTPAERAALTEIAGTAAGPDRPEAFLTELYPADPFPRGPVGGDQRAVDTMDRMDFAIGTEARRRDFNLVRCGSIAQPGLYRAAVSGRISSVLRQGAVNTGAEMAHEIGHLLGLNERYRPSGSTLPGFSGNIMSAEGGTTLAEEQARYIFGNGLETARAGRPFVRGVELVHGVPQVGANVRHSPRAHLGAPTRSPTGCEPFP